MREPTFQISSLLLAVPLVAVVAGAGGTAPAAAQAPEAASPAGEPGEPAATGEGEPAAESAEGAEEGAAAEEAAAETPQEDLAADFYLSRCAGCHTIGEGELSGPDLLPATGWPAPDLAKAVERMEKNVGPVTGDQVAFLVELLKDSEVKPRLSAAREWSS
jgi:mono/diheme cytochrome c family protein